MFIRCALQRLTKYQRIKTRPEFGRVFNQSKKIHTPYFKLMVHWTGENNPPRLGLIVSKKVNVRAVKRNLLKRLIRESFRRNSKLKSADYVIMAKPSANSLSNKQIMSDLEQLWQRI